MLRQALKADARRPRHERRAARALHTEIRAAGHDGGDSRVTDVIRDWREQEGQAAVAIAFTPLAFELGEAHQFDWSEAGLVVGGIHDGAQVARPDRLSNAGEGRYDWQHCIPLLQRMPGARRSSAPFADMPEALQRLRRGLTHQRDSVEAGHESIHFSRSTAEAKRRIKARDQGRKGTKPTGNADPF